MIANDAVYYDGKFVCCGDDLCGAIIPSTYDEYDTDVDDGIIMNIDNDLAEDVDSDSAEDIDIDSTGDIDNDSDNVQSAMTDINGSKWTNQTVDEINNSSNISTTSWLTILVIVIASSC